MKTNNNIDIVSGIIAIMALMLLVPILVAVPVMLIWNWLMPVLVPGGIIATKITFWQSFWLSVLCHILFKSTSVSK